MVEHNSEMFIASDNLAKHPKICYVPNAIINCDDETRKSQKHDVSLTKQFLDWL